MPTRPVGTALHPLPPRRRAVTGALRPWLVAAALAAAAPALPAAPPQPAGRTAQVKIRYEEPKDPAHRPLYDSVREGKILETFADVLAAVKLPRPLTLRFASCDGTSNAWYDPDDQTVTFCWEFVSELERAAGGAARYGIPKEDATYGTVVYLMLHETSHALFDLLQVPILGREEDAADQVAAYTLLRAGKNAARRALGGAAWMYSHDASQRTPDQSDFADVHGLDVQRFYNVMCMAYGYDATAFAGLVEKGFLPKDRAEGCAEEYQQVGKAVRKLISTSLDPGTMERTRTRYGQKWKGPAAQPTPAAAETK